MYRNSLKQINFVRYLLKELTTLLTLFIGKAYINQAKAAHVKIGVASLKPTFRKNRKSKTHIRGQTRKIFLFSKSAVTFLS